MRTWARRAKSIMASAESVEVGVVGQGRPVARHAITRSGALLFSLREAAPACVHLVRAGTRGPDILATAADVSGVAHGGRVRGVVRLGGRAEVLAGHVDEQLRLHLGIGEGDPVACLAPTSVTLDWRVEIEGGREVVHVAPEDYVAARVDALAGWQDGWLSHLDAHHGADLRQLAGSRESLDPGSVVRPLLADESGLVVREIHGDGYRDIRLAFPTVVGCGHEAVEALAGMLTPTRR